MVSLRILQPDDLQALDAFLVAHVASSMFLLGNSRTAGLTDRGGHLEGTYAAAFEGAELIGVVGHFWNGNLIVQAPEELVQALCELAMRTSGRQLAGVLGPSRQVGAVLSGFRIEPAQLQFDSVETLFSLQLDALRVPEPLRAGRVQARVARASDLELLTTWRVAYSVESLNAKDTPRLHASSRIGEERAITQGRQWLVEVDGEPVATTAFNAKVAEAVQIGGVYTPPAQRGRGYARAGVAQSLLDAQRTGVRFSTLFTGSDNVPAQRAYRALGYEPIGDYRIALLNG